MSIANILLGSLGAGAQSLGASRMQEQEQRRREAAQEQMRVRQAEEQGEQRRLLQDDKLADLKRQQEEGAAVARLLGVELPEGSRLTPDSVRLLATERQQRGASDRMASSLEGRLAQIEAQNNAQSEVRAAQAEASRARAETDAARGALYNRTDPNLRSPRAEPKDEYETTVRSIAQKLMESQRDQDGYMIGGMPPEQAISEARKRADLLFGRQSAPARPQERPGARLMEGLGGGRPPLDSFRR